MSFAPCSVYRYCPHRNVLSVTSITGPIRHCCQISTCSFWTVTVHAPFETELLSEKSFFLGLEIAIVFPSTNDKSPSNSSNMKINKRIYANFFFHLLLSTFLLSFSVFALMKLLNCADQDSDLALLYTLLPPLLLPSILCSFSSFIHLLFLFHFSFLSLFPFSHLSVSFYVKFLRLLISTLQIL